MTGGSFLAVLAILAAFDQVEGHGRLINPPSRATAWRYDFQTPQDYNDNAGFCGGYQVQLSNGGKCGVCGDNYADPEPRDHEAGGKYGTGTIVAHYKRGQDIVAEVEITANHMGYFVFKLCANNDLLKDPEQECFDETVLQTVDGQDRWVLPDHHARTYEVPLKLPKGLTCRQCILQWTYTAGNNFGTDKNGTSCLGCGAQENFRACADITISKFGGGLDSVPQPPPRVYRLPSERVECVPAVVWVNAPGMPDWCKNNCGYDGKDCPRTHCICG